MQLPHGNESLFRLKSRLVYHRSALLASGLLAQAVVPLDGLITRADALREAREQAQAASLMGAAKRQRADRAADRLVRQVEREALVVVYGNKAHAGFVALFHPLSAGELVRRPFGEQGAGMGVLADKLDPSQGAPALALSAGLPQRLREAAASLKEANEQYQAALGRKVPQSLELTLLREEVARLLRQDYADLLALLPQDRDEVEDHFLRFTRDTPNADDDGEDDEA